MSMNPMEDLMVPPTEMIQLPPPPNRSLQIFWPIHETFSMDPTGFQVIYPSYIDLKKTVKQGRRMPVALAVPTPTVSDMSLALQTISVRHVLQPYKGYSRDCETLWDNPGRVLVDISEHKKEELLRLIAGAIPTLPDRIARLEREAAEVAQAEQKMLEEKVALEKTTTSKKSAVGATGKKKKGKRK